MKTYMLCLLLFGFWLAIIHGHNIPLSPSFVAETHDNLRPLKRVARQDFPPPPDAIPPPPEIPPPPGMLEDHYRSLARKKREARGIGGSLPTRKG